MTEPAGARTASFESPGATTTPEPAPTDGHAPAKEDLDNASAQKPSTDDSVYPSGLKLALIIFATFASMFLVSLDRTIIATAIPSISDEFNSSNDIGWYGSGYLLTTCAFQLLFGKIYSFYSIKNTFLASVVLFEIGSAVCGAAPSSTVFIVGRAIGGLGGAGITSGVISILVHAVPLHKRPLYQGMIGAVFGLASVIGPLVGGAFTSKVTWRWCFYINLPFGGAAILIILFLLNIKDQDTTKEPIKARLSQLDFPGTALIVPGCVCLLLALQWGGSTYAWDNGRIIALLVLAAALMLGFVSVQIFLPKTATIAPRIFAQRSILAGFFSTLCIGSASMLFTYYLPLWFQAVQGLSAVDSGIRTLPLVISLVVASIASGVLISRIGYYTPFLIIGICFMAVGAGMMTTLQIDTSTAKLVGYQILYGFGLGLVSQVPNLAAQTVLPKADIPIGSSLMFFSQLLSGAIFVSVGQNILDNQLIQRLSSIPGFSAETVVNTGVTSLTNLPDSEKTPVLAAYNESIRTVFLAGLIITCLNMISALAMEWQSVKKDVKKQTSEGDVAAEKTEDGKLDVRNGSVSENQV
ncbi:major facilitator superfamily domain-containing protein [Xylariales sp. AK1849]|nr:major facilitator superfamily domain-containing protein [Xylariales sp. AK1849]